jgi:hypothetical protein
VIVDSLAHDTLILNDSLSAINYIVRFGFSSKSKCPSFIDIDLYRRNVKENSCVNASSLLHTIIMKLVGGLISIAQKSA